MLRHGDAVRPWQHVLDCLSGYLECGRRLLAEEDTPGALNFGLDAVGVATVTELAEKFLREWGGDATLLHEPAAGLWEARTLFLHNAFAKKALGWRPVLGLDDGIVWSARWHRRQCCGENAHDICEKQIAVYENLAGKSDFV